MASGDRSRRYLRPAFDRLWPDSCGAARKPADSNPRSRAQKEATTGVDFHRKQSLWRATETGDRRLPTATVGETLLSLSQLQLVVATEIKRVGEGARSPICPFDTGKFLLVPKVPTSLLAGNASRANGGRVKETRSSDDLEFDWAV